ncbi:MAG: hypothetical protein R3D63_00085 [Paracoccaceae bacterium]
MAGIGRDEVMGRRVEPAPDEPVLAEFRPDRMVYWKSHVVMAVVLGTAAGLFLIWQGNPWPVAGPLGAALAIGARAAYLASEALGDVWLLTERRLIGPGGRSVPLAQIRLARPFLGAVQVVTLAGDKHLIKYQADPFAVADRVMTATGRRA